MDKSDKNSCKGVRLQGFKGFKLKSTQILRKNNFSKNKFSGDALNSKTITKTQPNIARYDYISLKDVAHDSNTTGVYEKKLENEVSIQGNGPTLKHDSISLKGEPIRGMLVANCKVLIRNELAFKQLTKQRDNPCSNDHMHKPSKRSSESNEESSASKKARGNQDTSSSMVNDIKQPIKVEKREEKIEQMASKKDDLKKRVHVNNTAVCDGNIEQNSAEKTKIKLAENCNSSASPSTEIFSQDEKQAFDAADLKLPDLQTTTKPSMEITKINTSSATASRNGNSTSSDKTANNNMESLPTVNPYQDIEDVLPIKLRLPVRDDLVATDTHSSVSVDKPDETTASSKSSVSSKLTSKVVDENLDKPDLSEDASKAEAQIKLHSVCHKTKSAINGVLSSAAFCHSTATEKDTTVDAISSHQLGIISSERDKLAYPAKKRYHEWFKNKSEKAVFSAKSEFAHCDVTIALTASSLPVAIPATKAICNAESGEEHFSAQSSTQECSSQITGACEEAGNSVPVSAILSTNVNITNNAVDAATKPISNELDALVNESSSKLIPSYRVSIHGATIQTDEVKSLNPVSTSSLSRTLELSNELIAVPPKLSCTQIESSTTYIAEDVAKSPEYLDDKAAKSTEHTIKEVATTFLHSVEEAVALPELSIEEAVSSSKHTIESSVVESDETNKPTVGATSFSRHHLTSSQQSFSPSQHQNHLAESQKGRFSPLLSSEVISPVMDYTLSDTSSLAGSLSPIDIRIPIDNCEFSDAIAQPETASITVDDDNQKVLPETLDSKQCDSVEIAAEKEAASSFTLIEENIYLFQKKKSRARKEIRRMLCECMGNLEEPPCGENCLNRLLMIECSARCPFGELCTNKRFQRREYLRTEVFRTSWKGMGLRAVTELPAGQLVMEYCGEVLDATEFYRRSQLYAENNQQHFYFMALSQDEIIDATYKGNISRFINHSCKPNCETQKWTVNGRLCVGIFTINEVKAGEEITFDYQFESYGKERQKCYCGASTCRGYLGKATNYTTVPREKTVEGGSEYERKVMKEFKENSVENELNRLLNGLQTTKEVLLLCRLMVRSESVAERGLCLKVLRRTSNPASLKAFLHFHGLSLMWSWMVDLGGVTQLKAEILSTLAILPISNKNVLEDSKVLPMVVRWSEGESSVLQSTDSQDDVTSNFDDSDVTPVDNSTKENKELEQKILSLSLSLLTVWKNLKEIYRIPKRTKLAENAEGAQSEEDLCNSKSSSPSKQSHNNERSTLYDRRSELKHRHSPVRSRPRDDDVRSSKHDSGSKYESRLSRKEHRKQFEREMRLRKEKQEHDHHKHRKHSSHKSSSDTPPTTPSTPQTLTSTTPSTPQTISSTPESFTPAGYSGNLIQITPDPTFAPTIPPQQASTYLNPCSQGQPIRVIGASTNDQALLPPAQSTILATPYNYQPTSQLASVDNFGVTILGYDGPNVIVSLSPDQLKELTDLLAFKSLQQVTLQQPLLTQLPLTTPIQPIPALSMQPVAPLPTLPPAPLPAQPITPLPTQPSTPILTQSNQTTKPLTTETSTGTTQSTQQDTPSQAQAVESTTEVVPTPTSTSSSDACKSPAKDPRPTRLPPNWKTASDADGCVYYYHVITRQTQWDPPTWDASAEDMAGRKEGEMEMSTPTTEDKNATSNATATGKTLSDSVQARKAKEAFRSRMSQHIVTCLSAYRKQDCKVGRILTTDDFKKLARKLTHNILMKEIKQVQVWEDLECNANVKHKAKEYVRKYMARMGPVYRGKDEDR